MPPVSPRLQTPQQLAALAARFQPHLGRRVELVTWTESTQGHRPVAERRSGSLIAVTSAGFVLEVAGRGGCYRWFCGWVDLWTGHAVIRTPALAKRVRACWRAQPEPARAPREVAAGGGH